MDNTRYNTLYTNIRRNTREQEKNEQHTRLFKTGCAQRVKKASQSLPPAGGKGILIIFCRGVYLTENTYQAASVRFVRQGRTNRARGRLQSFCQKRAKPFFDSLSTPGCLKPGVLQLQSRISYSSMASR